MLRRSLLVAALVTLGCSAPRPVHFSSSPPGARIAIDGTDSGLVTPCLIQLEDASSREVDFLLTGYRPARRILVIRGRTEVVFWRECVGDPRTWCFPLWLGSKDFFKPIQSFGGESPRRVHVHLERVTDG